MDCKKNQVIDPRVGFHRDPCKGLRAPSWELLLMEEIRLTSWCGKYPIIYGVSYIPGGAGFLPSTVSYPIYGRGKSSSQLPLRGDILVPCRVYGIRYTVNNQGPFHCTTLGSRCLHFKQNGGSFGMMIYKPLLKKWAWRGGRLICKIIIQNSGALVPQNVHNGRIPSTFK